MNMEEFRNALASDAREENDKLKKELEEYKSYCNYLSERCYAIHGDIMCPYCMVESCIHYLEFQKNLDQYIEQPTRRRLVLINLIKTSKLKIYKRMKIKILEGNDNNIEEI